MQFSKLYNFYTTTKLLFNKIMRIKFLSLCNNKITYLVIYTFFNLKCHQSQFYQKFSQNYNYTLVNDLPCPKRILKVKKSLSSTHDFSRDVVRSEFEGPVARQSRAQASIARAAVVPELRRRLPMAMQMVPPWLSMMNVFFSQKIILTCLFNFLQLFSAHLSRLQERRAHVAPASKLNKTTSHFFTKSWCASQLKLDVFFFLFTNKKKSHTQRLQTHKTVFFILQASTPFRLLCRNSDIGVESISTAIGARGFLLRFCNEPERLEKNF